MSHSFDLVVIGGGPAGYVASLRAAQLGLKVACVSKADALGGTCLQEGCIPSKTLLHATEMYTWVCNHGESFGLQGKGLELNWETLQEKKQAVIKQFTQGIAGLMKKKKVSLFPGQAAFLSPHEIEVTSDKGKEQLQAKHVLIATGSEPISLPFLPFEGERVISSSGALSLSKPPKKMIIIGGGVIGLELGSVFRRLGTEITVVEALPEICPGMDMSLRKGLRKELEKQGMLFHLGAKATGSTEGKWTTKLTILDQKQNEQTLAADVILVSVGRRARTEGLQLEKINIQTDVQGRIPVNDQFQTEHKHIYAVGDVVDGPMLAHKASEEGVAVVEFLAGHHSKVSYIEVPSVVYTAPEVASVGFSEEELKENAVPYRKGQFALRANSRASCMGEGSGFVSVLADEGTDRILGVHILAPHASEMITQATMALHFGAKAKEVGSMCFPHPTLSEAFKEACLACHGDALHS